MALVLTFPLDTGVQATIAYRVRSIQFGEGFKQEVKDGLNNRDDSWAVTASGYVTALQTVLDFLDARGGAEAFLWTNPRGVQGLYKCKSYTTTDVHGDQMKISATFERSHQP